jgi:RNA polymerase sigma-70 factor (ECF subfamily)
MCPAPPSSLRERLASFYDQHGARIYRFVLALLGNAAEAEDCVQTAFLELARRPEILNRLESPAAYLLTMARNAAMQAHRRSQRRRASEVAHFLVARASAPQDPAKVEELERGMLLLPLDQREVLILKAFEEMTFEEIGAALEISPNTAASRYRYAIAKLRDILAARADR